MAITRIPQADTLTDAQFVTVEGPDGINTSFSYDSQQRALYIKESQVVFPSFHGASHVAQDPIPSATCDLPGLMSADDKCKLDALLQTRIGVIGFQGSGMPDDGGWLQGDMILAAGTDYISIERFGNVIRFTVDVPTPLTCICEECSQIFFVQDETDLTAIRPPNCSGKLPGINAYGELKVYIFPESTIVDINNTKSVLSNKGSYPGLFFKRYANSITPGLAQFEVVLKRDSVNKTTTEIGISMAPGTANIPDLTFHMGKDTSGNMNQFSFKPETNPESLGSVLYKGHLLTSRRGVITDYTPTVLSTNQYVVREWNLDLAKPVGDSFTAKNVWQYQNPENPTSGTNPKTLTLDATVDVIPIGTVVDLYYYRVATIAGQPILRYYFSKQPTFNPVHAWTWVGSTQFGDIGTAREEQLADNGSDDAASSAQVSLIRDFERQQWGLTGFDDHLLSYDTSSTGGTEDSDLSVQHRAKIDTDLPGLVVTASDTAVTNFSERPVWLWHRMNMRNAILRADIGRPSSSNFTPYDIVVRSPIDEHTEMYMRVVATGTINGQHYIRVVGVHFHDLPRFGSVRIVSSGAAQNDIYNYSHKLVFPTNVDTENILGGSPTDGLRADHLADSLVLVGGPINTTYTGALGDVIELLHQEYNSAIVRVEFGYNVDTGLVETQFKVGILDMATRYEAGLTDDIDDYVRGLADGYTVSAVYSQAGTFTGIGTQPESSPSTFVVYDGGAQVGGTESEYWNRLEVMFKENQLWIWWNGLLVPPNTTLSASLSSPVDVSTPYFPLTTTNGFGKYGMRLWPGASVRRLDLRTQITTFNEFAYSQIEIV